MTKIIWKHSKKELERILEVTRTRALPRTFYIKKKAQYQYYTPEDMEVLLTTQELKEVNKWMYGQTCGMITEDILGRKLKKPVVAYFASDVYRFFKLRYGGIVLFD